MIKESNPRFLLAELREGDFAHAGDKEAIDLVLNKVDRILSVKNGIKALDVGCGLSGTAAYINTKSSFDVYGIDIDSSAIAHGKSRYPEIKLFECDVMSVEKLFSNNFFDLIFMFNVLYAVQNKKESLQCLANVAKENAILTIFDYVSANESLFTLEDLAGKSIRPVVVKDLEIWLQEAGWELIELDDITFKYEEWYRGFLNKLNATRNSLLEKFTSEAINKVQDTFSFLLTSICKKQIGGAIISAKKSK
jgi:ubiquinone/menaquinone biosynthesis C-methylase UbiE